MLCSRRRSLVPRPVVAVVLALPLTDGAATPCLAPSSRRVAPEAGGERLRGLLGRRRCAGWSSASRRRRDRLHRRGRGCSRGSSASLTWMGRAGRPPGAGLVAPALRHDAAMRRPRAQHVVELLDPTAVVENGAARPVPPHRPSPATTHGMGHGARGAGGGPRTARRAGRDGRRLAGDRRRSPGRTARNWGDGCDELAAAPMKVAISSNALRRSRARGRRRRDTDHSNRNARVRRAAQVSVRKPIGLGVWVKVASPASCSAAISRPVAMPTDSTA